MADSTSVLIKHNLNVNNIVEFKSQLEKILEIKIQHTVIIYDYESELNYPVNYNGWSLAAYDFPDDSNIWLHENNERGRSVNFGKLYAYIEGFCLDRMSQWFKISYYIDNSDPEDESNFKRERTEIYKLAKRFGANECILLNGSRYDIISEDISNGISLTDAIAKYERNNPIKKVRNYLNRSTNDSFIDSRSKIQVLSLQKIDPNKKYVDSDDWYDTILIDNFSDLNE